MEEELGRPDDAKRDLETLGALRVDEPVKP